MLTRCQQYGPGAHADGSVSPPVQGQPGGLHSGTLHTAGSPAEGGAAGGAEPLEALAASLFGLSPDSQ